MTASHAIQNLAVTASLAEPKQPGYDMPRILRMTREEWRAQCLHDMANIFEFAFDVLDEVQA